MTRTRIGLALAVGFAGLLGLTACARGEVATPAAVVADAAQPVEAQVLAAMGFEQAPASDPVAQPSASPSGPAAKKQKQQQRGGHLRLGKNALHGEVVVKAKDGTKTIDFQRGTVTAIDDKTVTVKSTDGFTQTWTFGNPIKVVERRTTVQPSAIKVGAEIGVVGTKDGGTTTAHRIATR
jgi:hypothetical protein